MMLLMLLMLLMPVGVAPLSAFPIDAANETGIERLEGYRLAQLGKVPGNRLPDGARLDIDSIVLRLQGKLTTEQLHPAPDLSDQIKALLGGDASDYSIALLDISDPDRPVYGEYQADRKRNPGSVGKLVIALALFQTLADLYPDNPLAREQILRDAIVVADEFIQWDHHKVPFWNPEQMRLHKRRLKLGDAANLWSYLDWMLSASSNAAASMVLKHVMLLRHFGRAYPVSREQEKRYFEQTPVRELSDDLITALQEPLRRNGFDPDRFRQGGFFSHIGKQRVPGTDSIATGRQLLLYLIRMEQGKLVDSWSSLQMKRLLYLTRRRIRYASSPALKNAAVFFKSGSFYKCRPEADFSCKPYTGNVLNLMNSVTIVEWPAGHPSLDYMVVVTSNVLRKNSAVEQQTLATRLHRLMQRRHQLHAGPR